jgi:hypothetical protein
VTNALDSSLGGSAASHGHFPQRNHDDLNGAETDCGESWQQFSRLAEIPAAPSAGSCNNALRAVIVNRTQALGHDPVL